MENRNWDITCTATLHKDGTKVKDIKYISLENINFGDALKKAADVVLEAFPKAEGWINHRVVFPQEIYQEK